MKKYKQLLYSLINGFLLRPFNLTLSYNIGKDPFADLKRLMNNHVVGWVIDGGAYRGDFTVAVTNYFPTAKVIAFEPQKDSFSLLASNVAGLRNITLMNYALGENSGDAILYCNVSPMTNSLSKSTSETLRIFKGYNDPVGHEKVQVMSLADFLENEGIQRVDLLKLDLQGHELNAIRGLKDRLKDVMAIYIEVEFMRLYEGAALFSDVEKHLREHNFIFFQLYDQVRSPESGRLLYGDAIFLNNNYFTL